MTARMHMAVRKGLPIKEAGPAMTQPTNAPGFAPRIACPVCAGADLTRIYTARYDEDPVRALVQSNFGRQGVIDWSLLAGVPSNAREKAYIEAVLPAKLELALEGARHASVIYDLSVIARTLLVVLEPERFGDVRPGQGGANLLARLLDDDPGPLEKRQERHGSQIGFRIGDPDALRHMRDEIGERRPVDEANPD